MQFKQLFELLPYVPLLVKGVRNNRLGFGLDIIDDCPIGCMCYWRAQGRVQKMTDDEVVQFVTDRRDEGYMLALYVGGEPYLRWKLLQSRLATIMPASWLITSGVLPLKPMRRTTHFVSIDGKDAETHDRIRGYSGLYDKIHRNLELANKEGISPVYIHAVLNAENMRQAEEIIRHWRDNGLVQGVIFSTMTPITGAHDDGLRLTDDHRRWIVDELLRLRGRYGNFLLNTPTMSKAFHPNSTRRQTPENCSVARHTISFYADGSAKKQCIFTEKGDCTGCGCVVTAFTNIVTQFPGFDLETVRMVKQLCAPAFADR